MEHLISFSFTEWYARMGYHRHGGQRACADAIGKTTRHVRYLLNGERQPDQTLIKLCELIRFRECGE